MASVLIVYATVNGQSEKVAGYMAGRLRARGVDARALCVDSGEPLPAVSGVDAVILGGSVHLGRFQPALEASIRDHLTALQAHPNAAFYSVSGSASRGYAVEEVEATTAAWLEALAWQPRHCAHFGGAVKYPRYDLITRWVMRRISAQKGEGTDTRREFEYTDWDAVDAFVDAIIPATP